MSSTIDDVVLTLNVPMPEPPTVITPPSMQDQLMTLVTSIVSKKPQTKTDAIALLHELNTRLVPWLVSELPAEDQKNVLVTVWTAKQVASVACVPCLPK